MRRYLYITVFFSGLTSLAVEMAASRLLGNVFGTSNLVWASIIGLILIYLAAGYFWGGTWADRSPSAATFFKILIWASLLIALVPLISRPVLRLAANAFDDLQLGVLFGSFTTVLVLLSLPITLLGTASPFAIRLAIEDAQGAGRVSGKIYAISTLGSFIGTFLPVLILIPLVGTYRTFVIVGGLLLLVSLFFFWKTSGLRAVLPYLWTPLILIAELIWGFQGTDKTTREMVYETESAYNYIQVIQQDDYRYLRLNEGQGMHSVYNPNQLDYMGPWEQVLVAPYFNKPPYDPSNIKRMAIVGLAAGTTARQATAVYGNLPIDGYEIDPKIVEVGKKYFDMNMPNLNVILQDGRWGLDHSPYKYQVISVDAYRPPYIPWYMTSVEFFQVVRRHLSDDGVLVINVGRGPTDRRMVNALGTTILQVFPTVHVVDIPNAFNSIIFATAKPTEDRNLVDNFGYLEKKGVHPLLLDTMRIAAANLRPAPETTLVFTDDRAPVEYITNSMVLDFIFSDQIEELQ